MRMGFASALGLCVSSAPNKSGCNGRSSRTIFAFHPRGRSTRVGRADGMDDERAARKCGRTLVAAGSAGNGAVRRSYATGSAAGVAAGAGARSGRAIFRPWLSAIPLRRSGRNVPPWGGCPVVCRRMRDMSSQALGRSTRRAGRPKRGWRRLRTWPKRFCDTIRGRIRPIPTEDSISVTVPNIFGLTSCCNVCAACPTPYRGVIAAAEARIAHGESRSTALRGYSDLPAGGCLRCLQQAVVCSNGSSEIRVLASERA